MLSVWVSGGPMSWHQSGFHVYIGDRIYSSDKIRLEVIFQVCRFFYGLVNKKQVSICKQTSIYYLPAIPIQME
jgi:hypothetical protein